MSCVSVVRDGVRLERVAADPRRERVAAAPRFSPDLVAVAGVGQGVLQLSRRCQPPPGCVRARGSNSPAVHRPAPSHRRSACSACACLSVQSVAVVQRRAGGHARLSAGRPRPMPPARPCYQPAGRPTRALTLLVRGGLGVVDSVEFRWPLHVRPNPPARATPSLHRSGHAVGSHSLLRQLTELNVRVLSGHAVCSHHCCDIM